MVTLDSIVLPAFRNDEWAADEVRLWRDRHDFTETVQIANSGADYHTPLYHDGQIGLLATGIGPTAAALSVSALIATDAVDCSDALFLTAGVAGGPPARSTLGTTFVHDAVVDWDAKHRIHEGDLGTEGDAVQLIPHRPRDYVYHLNDGLVERALDVAGPVALDDGGLESQVREHYGDADPPSDPALETGTTVCGAEFWHGPTTASEVEWLVEQYDAGPYRTTESEDAGTAHALQRHGALDRYLSVRSVSNFDRPPAGTDPSESLHDWEDALPVAAENTYRVASAIVEDLRANHADWRALF